MVKLKTNPSLLKAIAVILLILILTVVYIFTSPKDGKSSISLKTDFSPKPTIAPRKLVVDIEGAVKKPGVYSVESEKRIADILQIAGGPLDDADKAFIEKEMNKAQKLFDGMKIYVPKIGENVVIPKDDQNTLINLNSSDAAALDSLPGIGKTTAEKIVKSRPYAKKEELLERSIVNKSIYEKIKDLIDV